MGHRIKLDTPHGSIGGWRAEPEGRARGGLVVMQEIFGVNANIRSVVERFATNGYTTIAPAPFDLIARGVALDYDQAGYARGRELATAVGFERALDCVHAAVLELNPDLRGVAGESHPAIAGYSWGGSVAFLANTRLGLPAVSYYGARTLPFLAETSTAPMLFHFGAQDASIPPQDIEKHRAAQPQAEIHVWPAGHGFNCEQRKDYDADSATHALEFTLEFLERALAGLSPGSAARTLHAGNYS